MPLNRSTLIRISTIDRCLQNRYRRWTIDDLMDACTDFRPISVIRKDNCACVVFTTCAFASVGGC